jgi:integrase
MTVELCASTRDWIARSPCRRELLDFADWLEAERYTAFVCDQHLRRLAFVVPRLAPEGRIQTYSGAQLEDAFGPERTPRSRLFRFAATRRAYGRYLLDRGRFRAEPAGDRFAALRGDYARFLLEVRGLSESARQHHAHEVADFLSRAIRPRQSLRSLRREEIEAHVLVRSREVSRYSMQHVVGILRSFLRYIHHAGLIPAALDSMDTPRIYRGELPPKALPWPTVRRLLASIDRHSKAGWRDLCILHLIAYYGLRPSEVAALRLDSIDWEAGVIHVRQRKTRSDLQLPLAAPTIKLLRQYLAQYRNGQGTTDTELFLRARCPNGRIERTAVGDIFEKRAREAGLPGGSHVYRLRHTFAMRLLTRGVGVKAIGDVLGHRSIDSTCAYLRLDIATLRGVALPVPHPRRPVAEGVRHA